MFRVINEVEMRIEVYRIEMKATTAFVLLFNTNNYVLTKLVIVIIIWLLLLTSYHPIDMKYVPT